MLRKLFPISNYPLDIESNYHKLYINPNKDKEIKWDGLVVNNDILKPKVRRSLEFSVYLFLKDLATMSNKTHENA